MLQRINIILIAAIVFSLMGCSGVSDTTSDSPSGATRTITDMSGREVQIPVHISRIAITPIPWTSVLYAVDGSGERIVGMNPSAKRIIDTSMLGEMAPELHDASTDFTSEDFIVNSEELMKLKPDVLIQWAATQLKEGELEKDETIGIPVITLTYGTTENLKDNLKLFGELLGKEERATQFIDAIDESENYLKPRVSAIKDEDKPSVFYLQDGNLKTSGEGSFQDYAFEKTGAKNVAHDSGKNSNANMEQVIAWNPDIIYISNFCTLQPSDVLENKIKGQDWSGIKAVKDGMVFKIPMGLYRWDAPSTETPLFMKWLAQTQHPEIFNEYSIIDEVQKFFKNMFNFDMSNEKAKTILNLN